MSNLGGVIEKNTGQQYLVKPLSYHLDDSNLIELPQHFIDIPIEARYLWNETQKAYLEQQLTSFLGSLNIDRNQILTLDRLLILATRFMWAAVGEHETGFSLKVKDNQLSTFINLASRPNTHCAVFNSIYIRVFETLCEMFNPELLKMHKIITTYSRYAQDMGRNSKGDRSHLYCILLSNSSDGIVMSSIDPYFTPKQEIEMGKEDISLIDQTTPRSVEAVFQGLKFSKQNQGEPYTATQLIESSDLPSKLTAATIFLPTYADLNKNLDFLIRKKELTEKLKNELLTEKQERENGSPRDVVENEPMSRLFDHLFDPKSIEELEQEIIDLQNELENIKKEEEEIVETLFFIKSGIVSAIDDYLTADTADLLALRAFIDLVDQASFAGVTLDPSMWLSINNYLYEIKSKKGWRQIIEQHENRRLRLAFGRDSFIFANGPGPEEMELYIEFKVNYCLLMANWDLSGWEDQINGDIKNEYFLQFILRLTKELEMQHSVEEADSLKKRFSIN